MDIKPANMEVPTEVITAAEYHPHQFKVFVYSRDLQRDHSTV